MRLIEFNTLTHTHARYQENQRENVNSQVAPPYSCHAVKEERIPNEYLEQT